MLFQIQFVSAIKALCPQAGSFPRPRGQGWDGGDACCEVPPSWHSPVFMGQGSARYGHRARTETACVIAGPVAGDEQYSRSAVVEIDALMNEKKNYGRFRPRRRVDYRSSHFRPVIATNAKGVWQRPQKPVSARLGEHVDIIFDIYYRCYHTQ